MNVYYCVLYIYPLTICRFTENFDTRGIKCLENHIKKPDIAWLGTHKLVLGDVNARTADRNDYIYKIHVVPTLRHYEEYLQDNIITKRASCDTNTNTIYLDLIPFCKTHMMHICNGRYDEDKDTGR